MILTPIGEKWPSKMFKAQGMRSNGQIAPLRNCTPACRGRMRKHGVQHTVCAFGRNKNAQMTKTVPVVQSKPSTGPPLVLKLGAVIVLAAAAVKLFNKLRNRGSMDALEDRGFIAEGGQDTSGKDPFVNNMMKNYNTVQYQTLSDDQIEAARQRRSQDRRNDAKVDLSKIQLPANHPFAVSKQISDEEEKLQIARLNVRRGMPLKDSGEGNGRQAYDMPNPRPRQTDANRDPAAQRRRGAS